MKKYRAVLIVPVEHTVKQTVEFEAESEELARLACKCDLSGIEYDVINEEDDCPWEYGNVEAVEYDGEAAQ